MFFIFSKLFNASPKNTVINTKGEKPMLVEIQIFNLFILSDDNIKFCKNKGGPGIILNIIKYSKDESLIYLLIL